MLVLPTSYFGPIYWFALYAQNSDLCIEHFENFKKQSNRSRCTIYGANASLALSIPLRKWKNHTPIHEIEISYDENWQKIHWKSIESAYRASPYFEYYESNLSALFLNLKEKNLVGFNAKILKGITELLQLSQQGIPTSSYVAQEPDWRIILNQKGDMILSNDKLERYPQVFEEKHGFIPNLSIIDLLFNLGPSAQQYLLNIQL